MTHSHPTLSHKAQRPIRSRGMLCVLSAFAGLILCTTASAVQPIDCDWVRDSGPSNASQNTSTRRADVFAAEDAEYCDSSVYGDSDAGHVSMKEIARRQNKVAKETSQNRSLSKRKTGDDDGSSDTHSEEPEGDWEEWRWEGKE